MKQLHFKNHTLLTSIILIVPFTGCKKDQDEKPKGLHVAKWRTVKVIDRNFDANGNLIGTEHERSVSGVAMVLNNNGSGTYVSGTNIVRARFNYTVSDSKINYTNYQYYKDDGTKSEYTEDDYSDIILSLTANSMITYETYGAKDLGNGKYQGYTLEVYWEKVEE